jgi:hypothetical protein
MVLDKEFSSLFPQGQFSSFAVPWAMMAMKKFRKQHRTSSGKKLELF